MVFTTVLDALNVNYQIEPVPADGDCFYHAVSKQLNGVLDHKKLRTIVAQMISEDDVQIFNSLNSVNFTIEKLKKELQKCGKIWGDNMEIACLARAFPSFSFIIFDDHYKNVLKIESDANVDSIASHYIYLRRRSLHYESVKISKHEKRKIQKLMLKKNYHQVRDRSSSFMLIISILVPTLIFFKFSNKSL